MIGKRFILNRSGGLPAHACMTGTKRWNAVGRDPLFAGREMANVPGGDLLIKDGQQRWRYLPGRGGVAVVIPIGPIEGEMDDLVLCVLDATGLRVAKTKEFDGIIVQPFQHISVMDIADLKFAIGTLEGSGGIGIRRRRGGYLEEDELVRIVLAAIEPRLPARRLPAFKPGDQKPVSYPIKQQKC